MIDLVFASPALSSLRHALYHEALESAAILLAVPVQLPTNRWRLLVAEIHVAGEGDYEERSKVAVRLTPSFGLPLEKKAKLNGWSIIYCHTHPWQSGTPRYSSIDDSSEVLLAQYAKARVRNVPHLSLLFGMEHVIGRELGLTNVIRIWEIGSHLECVHDPHETVIERTKHSRQIQAFGEEGQRQVQRLRVAVVGLGGTGSVVVQQLAYLGVTDYILVDPDVIDASNLNRVVGAVPSDIGNKHKVEIAQSIITSQRPHARITIIRDDVLKPDATRSLREAHIVFCCTDSEASRHLLNQFAYQYWIPVIDVGVGIHVQTHAPIQIAGRVAMLSPGLPCLWCLEQLNPANNKFDGEFTRGDHVFICSGGLAGRVSVSYIRWYTRKSEIGRGEARSTL